MPPLRKKGRGGGGGKTEAPLPGEVLGTSPSVSASLARKEREKKLTSSSLGIENLGMFVSRSFQRERGEKKLLEASRTSLHLTSGSFQKSAKPRKVEPSSGNGTPRVGAANVSVRREDKVKKSTETVQRTSTSSGYKSACRGREEPPVCRTSCRELGEEKIFRRSARAVEEKRKAGRKDEKSTEHSTRYNSIYPGISGDGKGVREFQPVDRGSSLKSGENFASQRLDRRDEKNLSKASPSPPSSTKSPRITDSGNVVVHSPVTSLPVKSSCKCGTFRSSDTGNSPKLQILDERRRGASPIPPPMSRDIVEKNEAKERKSRDLVEILQGTPPQGSSTHNSGSASRSSTPYLLQGRLALLEGRVSQIAAELKATKDLLDANNPACSKSILSEIQVKITGIEKSINYRLAKQCGLMDQLEAEQFKGTFIQANDGAVRSIMGANSKNYGEFQSGCEIEPHGQGMYGKVSKNVHHTRALTLTSSASYDWSEKPDADQLSPGGVSRSVDPTIFNCVDHSLLPGGVGGSAPSSHVKPSFNHDEFEERLFPHLRLLRNRPSVQQKLMENRAALHQKLVENGILLKSKLAALEEREGLNCGVFDNGEFGAAEFISSLKQGAKLDRDFERGKGVRNDSGSSRTIRMFPGEVDGDMFPQDLRGNYLEYNEDAIPTREQPSREGRRSSESRKSLTTLDPANELAFNPLERVSTITRRDRRRRSSDKRKSMSAGCSPEPLRSASHIVTLEPTGMHSDPLPAVDSNPASSELLELECAETFFDENQAHAEEEWLGDGVQENVDTLDVFYPSTAGLDDDELVNLACDEVLSSEDPTHDPPDIVQNNENDEQASLDESESNVPGERLHQIGSKTATAGWFIAEGDGLLLAHDDGCCSYYDTANMEGKATFKPPSHLPPGTWRDCWLIRAAGSNGASNKYVVATSAGSALDSAFCSWDFYDRSITAFHSESSSLEASPGSFSFRSSASTSPERRAFQTRERQKPGCFSWYSGSENAQLLKARTPSGPLSPHSVSGAFCPSESESSDLPLRWYRPCSPLIASAASGSKTIALYDVRDGDVVMKWDLSKWVACMEHSCSIQWRNRGKIVVAEDHSISLWDVNTMTPQRLHSIDFSGKELRAMHVRNSDAEFSGGVRQRLGSRDNISGDGVLCTQDAVNVLDFRLNGGIALKIPTFGETAHSVSTNGDSVFAGVTVCGKVDSRSMRRNVHSKVNEWSIRQGKPMRMYRFPSSSTHQSQQSVAQVWGTPDIVMGVNCNGLFMFDSMKGNQSGKGGDLFEPEVIGTDDLVQPTFDIAGNRVLLVSRDKPAFWCHWP